MRTIILRVQKQTKASNQTCPAAARPPQRRPELSLALFVVLFLFVCFTGHGVESEASHRLALPLSYTPSLFASNISLSGSYSQAVTGIGLKPFQGLPQPLTLTVLDAVKQLKATISVLWVCQLETNKQTLARNCRKPRAQSLSLPLLTRGFE